MKWKGERAMPSPRHKKRAAKEEDEKKKGVNILIFIWGIVFGWTQESQAQQREEKEGGSNT